MAWQIDMDGMQHKAVTSVFSFDENVVLRDALKKKLLV